MNWERRRRTNDYEEDLRHLKLVFPSFNEVDDASLWIKDCEQYFDIYHIQEVRKVVIATMHLQGSPKFWYKTYAVGKEEIMG